MPPGEGDPPIQTASRSPEQLGGSILPFWY